MKTNKDILNEAFFKKATYEEKMKSKLPQYSPLYTGNGKKLTTSVGSQLNVDNSVFAVKDTDEVKKRLAGTFGATFGNNSIRSMASKAIKEFPILVSDNVEPDTIVMLKNLFESQYAEYINLMVSNSVVDLGDYQSGNPAGNIAIQALDTISGTDFSSSRVANNAARSGKFSADDIFANVPLYNLLRESESNIDFEDDLLNALLENALIVPSEKVNDVVTFLQEAPDLRVDNDNPDFRLDVDNNNKYKSYSRFMTLKDYIKTEQEAGDYNRATDAIYAHDEAKDSLRGFQGLDKDGREIYNKLTNAEILFNREMLDSALNRSVGEMLTAPGNERIRDRFEKATFLLQSQRIAGSEYIDYCTMRLGIPMSVDVRREILKRYRVSNLVLRQSSVKDRGNNYELIPSITRKEIRAISTNQKASAALYRKWMNSKVKTVIATTATGVAGAAGGAGVASLLGVATSALLGPALLGAAVGAGAFLLTKLIVNRKHKPKPLRIEGWERVEELIVHMEQQQADIRGDREPLRTDIKQDFNVTNSPVSDEDIKKSEDKLKKYAELEAASGKDITEVLKSIREFTTSRNVLRENVELEETVENLCLFFNESAELNLLEDLIDVITEASEDKQLKATLLSEAITTSIPTEIKYVDRKPGKDAVILPTFGARNNIAYGSTEIERRDMKDRRYNQPLIMTIKFKERFSDGKFADNELTAVIGILGKVIRIPSEELKYILKTNSEGQTVTGIFKNSGAVTNLVSDLLSTSRISKDVKNLPQSIDVWKNLEKVATLAASNKLAGKKTSNIANAHIVLSQKEVDEVRSETGIDYLKDTKLTYNLMKRYSAFSIMVANDPGQRLYIFDDPDAISWNVVPYSSLMGKDSGDQLVAALSRLGRM